MEGPTPVSALIHAATMVTAGVYMVARSNAMFVLAPTAMKTVAIVGALTAIFAASIGLVQNDIKRVLAYSTVSQLGYMFLALGVGAFAAGVFHVFTHAFFKALLFLGSGSVIHAMSGEQDMRNMGDLRAPHPHHPSGRCSSPRWRSPASSPSPDSSRKTKFCGRPGPPRAAPTALLWFVGYGTALMTAFYMFRLMYLTFHGQPRMSHEVEHHIHESPKSMTVPLVILAILFDRCGMVGLAAQPGRLRTISRNSSSRCLPGKRRSCRRGEAGAVGGWRKRRRAHRSDRICAHVPFARGWRAWVGEWRGQLLRATRAKITLSRSPPKLRRSTPSSTTSVTWTKATTTSSPDVAKWQKCASACWGWAKLPSWFDAQVIDGAVNGAGWVTRAVGTLSTWWDKWIIDGVVVNGPAILARMMSYPVRLFEWGLVQWYALVMVAGLLGLFFITRGSR